MYICIYIKLNHFAVPQKLTQYCKSTILDFLKRDISPDFCPSKRYNNLF